MSIHEHIRREVLPWRSADEARTECGLPPDSRTTISLDAMHAKIKREGKERAAMTSCMTCWRTVNINHKDREGDLLPVIQREIQRVWGDSPDRARLQHEFAAIVALIERHRAEFDTLVQDHGEVVSLIARKRAKAIR